MTSYKYIVASVFVLLTGCFGQEGQGADASVRLQQIDDVLHSALTSGSLVYQGHCGRSNPEAPPIQVLSDYSGPPIETLQRMFVNVPHMRVTQEPGGMIRMVDTDVPTDLLEVKIGHLSFKPIVLKPAPWEWVQTPSDVHMLLRWPGQTPGDPNFRGFGPATLVLGGSGMALEFILNASEVSTFNRVNNIRPFSTGGWSVPGNSGSEPPLVGELDNVTLLQALDYELGAFPGFWIYENCIDKEGRRTVRFNFFQRYFSESY